MTEAVVFRLSSIDQSSVREYIRYALCYPCDNDAASIDAIASKLTASLKRGVSYMPILAGKVHPVSAPTLESTRRHTLADNLPRQYPLIHQRRATVVEDISNEQVGQLEVRVTAEEVDNIAPTFKTLGKDEFPHSYAELSTAGMPPLALIGHAFTPLADVPDERVGGSPVLAVQASFYLWRRRCGHLPSPFSRGYSWACIADAVHVSV